MKRWRIHREDGAVRLELGRLWFVRCAPPRPGSAGHPNCWMVAWRRRLPEWDHESHERLKTARAVAHAEWVYQKIKDEEYATEARETAEREAAANTAQASRLRAIDQLLAQRGKKL